MSSRSIKPLPRRTGSYSNLFKMSQRLLHSRLLALALELELFNYMRTEHDAVETAMGNLDLDILRKSWDV